MALVLAASLPESARSQNDDRPCKVLPPPSPAGLVSFEADHSYDLRVERRADGLHVRVIADTLVVNAKDTESLVRSPADAATGIAELVLDARRITIAAPISLAGGKLRIIGEEVAFEGGGRLSLTRRATAADGLAIVARQLRFGRGLAKPFNVPLEADPQRSVRLSVVEVLNGGAVVPEDQRAAFLWSKAVDSAFRQDSPANWTAQRANEAFATYQTALRDETLWPLRFAGKVASHLARDPYGQDTPKQLLEAIDQARPALTEYRDPKPLLDVLRFETLLNNRLDLGGHSGSFAPRQSLENQLKDLETDLMQSRGNGSYLASLRELYLAPLTTERFSRSVADTMTRQIQDRDREVRTLRGDLDTKITRLASLSQEAESVRSLLDQRRAIVKTLTDREIERQRDASSIKQWTTVGATAVALGATLVGAAPVGAAIAAGIATGGEIAYEHNTDGVGWKDLGTIAAKGKATYDSSMALADKWNKYKQRERDLERVLNGEQVLEGDLPPPGQPGERKPLTKGRAAIRATEALGVVGGEVGKLTGGFSPGSGPTPINLSDKEAKDAELIGHINHLARLAKEQSDLTAEIGAANLQLATLVTTLEAERETRDQLLAAKPANDRELYRWQSNARQLWHLELARLAESASLLRRSLYFETGRLPGGPADALYYPQEFEALARFGGADPFANYSGENIEKDLRVHLDEQERRFLVSLEALVRGVRDARKAYLASRPDATVYRFSHRFRKGSVRGPEDAFIAALNGQLAQQIALGTPIDKVLPAPLPIRFAAAPLDFPERVVAVRITNVEFTRPVNLQGSGLRFQVIHPGVGHLQRGGKCIIADLRVNDGENRRIFVTDVNAVDGQWPQREPSSVSLTAADRFYIYYPLRTAFTVLAQVTTNAAGWRAVPEISSLEISWEVMQ